jgi:Putative MetA-pathway of phenol degradation
MPRFLLLLCMVSPLAAQLPFYTDDPAVTERGKLHFEFFNEYDALQSPQYPDLRQNTANYKVNYGLPFNLELDLDVPYLAIYRASGTNDSAGMGDTDLGVKWNYHKEATGSRVPALGVSLYIEFPTGSTRQQLSSGLTDSWLNFMAQKSLSDKTRINGNAGYLFAGNTSTGVIGIETTRGHVFTAGSSILHQFTPRLTLGAEVYGGFATNRSLAKSQLQGLLGGQYTIRNGFALAFGLLGGKYIASPRIGGQIGFSVDFPDAVRPRRQSSNDPAVR